MIALIVVVASLHPTSGPKLATSCTAPALAVAPASVKQHGVVRYSVTGPADQLFAVAVDAAGVRRTADGKYAALSPAPGAQSQAVGISTLKGCRRSGAFQLELGPGVHRVTLFRVVNGQGAAVASRPVTVTPS